MKRIILAAGIGLSVLSFAMAGKANYSTASNVNGIIVDTTPTDTTQPTPAPMPDTTTVR